jgi:hypothetical protein
VIKVVKVKALRTPDAMVALLHETSRSQRVGLGMNQRASEHARDFRDGTSFGVVMSKLVAACTASAAPLATVILLLLPACAPSAARSFETSSSAARGTPSATDPRARLILERTACFGDCPAFVVEVHPDGSVLYDGRSHVRVPGARTWTIERSAAAALFARAASAHPESWQRSYDWSIKDAPIAFVTVDLGSDAGPLRFKDNPTCRDKRGLAGAPLYRRWPPMSAALCALEDDIYASTGAARYVECHGEDLFAGRCEPNAGP